MVYTISKLVKDKIKKISIIKKKKNLIKKHGHSDMDGSMSDSINHRWQNVWFRS